MEDWMYEKFSGKYALDPEMQEWFKDVNPWALQRIAEVLLEASQRGADCQAIFINVRKLFLKILKKIEDISVIMKNTSFEGFTYDERMAYT